MKAHSKQLPERIEQLGNGRHNINYAVETTTDEQGNPDYVYDYATINGEPTYEEIVEAIIRDKYTASQETAIINNFNEDSNTQEYIDYLRHRDAAKFVAQTESLIMKEQFDTFLLSVTKIKVIIPIAKVLTGGAYASLADMMLKKRAIYSATDTHVTVWLSYLLPEHRTILEADPEVTIE